MRACALSVMQTSLASRPLRVAVQSQVTGPWRRSLLRRSRVAQQLAPGVGQRAPRSSGSRQQCTAQLDMGMGTGIDALPKVASETGLGYVFVSLLPGTDPSQACLSESVAEHPGGQPVRLPSHAVTNQQHSPAGVLWLSHSPSLSPRAVKMFHQTLLAGVRWTYCFSIRADALHRLAADAPVCSPVRRGRAVWPPCDWLCGKHSAPRPSTLLLSTLPCQSAFQMPCMWDIHPQCLRLFCDT